MRNVLLGCVLLFAFAPLAVALPGDPPDPPDPCEGVDGLCSSVSDCYGNDTCGTRTCSRNPDRCFVCNFEVAAGWNWCPSNNGCCSNFGNNAMYCNNSCVLGFCPAGTQNCDNNLSTCEKNMYSNTDCRWDQTNCAAGLNCTNRPNSSGGTCNSGSCSISCNAGFFNCNGSPDDGCEVNTMLVTSCGSGCSTTNCTTLANTTATSCVSSACVINDCADNYADCNAGAGCETNVGATTTCGSCTGVVDCGATVAHASGVGCALASGGTATKPSYACTYTGVCSAGFASCDGNKANGCETDLTAVTSCGACGNNCLVNVANIDAANIACVAGGCTYTGSCEAGAADCDGDKMNGCEVNLLTDVEHCAACDSACAAPSGGAASCTDGVCAFACDAGLKKCATTCAICCADSDCGNDPSQPANKCRVGACTNGACVYDNKKCDDTCKNPLSVACNPTTGECGGEPQDGGPCGEGCCNGGGTCKDGACECANGALVDCTSGLTSCERGTCKAGVCGKELRGNGQSCDANDKCMKGGTCSNGGCTGTPIVCTPSSDCKTAACDGASGTCHETPRPDGAACALAGCVEAACASGLCVCSDPIDLGVAPDHAVASTDGGPVAPASGCGGCRTSEGTSTATMLALLLWVVGVRVRRRV